MLLGVSMLEIVMAFLIGILFLMYGVLDFFMPSKIPVAIRFVIRFFCISMGTGFVFYAVLRSFGLIPS